MAVFNGIALSGDYLALPRGFYAIDCQAHRRNLCIEEQHVLVTTPHDLRHYFLAVRVGHLIVLGIGQDNFRQTIGWKGFAVVHDDRHAANSGIHLAHHASNTMSHHVGELLQRQQFIVPRKLVCTGYRGSGHIIVELMPDDTLPRLYHCLGGVLDCS